LFFPMFLLAGGGPPPGAMSDVMADVSTWLPLTHVTRAIQEPWLGLGTNTDHVVVNLAVFAVATVWWLLAAGGGGGGERARGRAPPRDGGQRGGGRSRDVRLADDLRRPEWPVQRSERPF